MLESGLSGRTLAFERSGTHVAIATDLDLDLDAALGIADSMRPALTQTTPLHPPG